MKKLLIIICLEMFVLNCSSIHKVNLSDNMGQAENGITKDSLFLNEIEGICLNKIFETTRKDFDFTNKKIGFITGSSGKTKSSKEYYFDMYKKHSIDKNFPYDIGTLYIFNASQKEESGGYDAAIVYWSKFVIPIEKVVKRLKEKN